jgi:hypothetical protein
MRIVKPGTLVLVGDGSVLDGTAETKDAPDLPAPPALAPLPVPQGFGPAPRAEPIAPPKKMPVKGTAPYGTAKEPIVILEEPRELPPLKLPVKEPILEAPKK